ncbi:MAG: hypothetical protein O4859_01115, partial [Trichodesmium sp. St18_bin1]|nr:hypothetical protein [Trichodesmium sp. St18_bin1]
MEPEVFPLNLSTLIPGAPTTIPGVELLPGPQINTPSQFIEVPIPIVPGTAGPVGPIGPVG